MNHKAISQRRLRFTVWPVLVLLLLFSSMECLGLAFSEEKTPQDIHHTESHHGEPTHSGKEHAPSGPVPMTYRVYWIGLIILAVLILGYFLIMYKKERIRLFPSLTVLLFLLAIFLYILEQLPFFAGYFEPARGFIPGYHEPNTIGFLRFLYKLLLGIGLCAYGFVVFFSYHKRRYKS
ncbi:MAG: hypothetical protein ACMUIA_00310 [bacterium]